MDEWNIEHIATHGVAPSEVEYIVNHYPIAARGDRKFAAVGQLPNGEWLQVIFIFSPAGVVFVIHARLLTESEKRRYRRRK